MVGRINIAGEMLVLLPERAAWWERSRTVLVTDMHLGKSATFRGAGVPVPETTRADLMRLDYIIGRTRAERLVILGDLIHARSGRVAASMDAFCEWRGTRRELCVELIRGNHDQRAGDPPPEWCIGCNTGPVMDGAFVYRHDPGEDERGYMLCGHLHPAVRMHGNGGSLRAPCFWFGERCGVLPAFGSFTGASVVRPRRGDRVFAVGEGSVIEVSLVEA